MGTGFLKKTQEKKITSNPIFSFQIFALLHLGIDGAFDEDVGFDGDDVRGRNIRKARSRRFFGTYGGSLIVMKLFHVTRKQE